VSTQRSTIHPRARSDGLRLLKAINETQAHGNPQNVLLGTCAAEEAPLL
jgi:hypothetical protein